MTPEELVDSLRAQQAGRPAPAAAVELLAAHGLWIRRMAAWPSDVCVDQQDELDWVELAGMLRRGELVGTGTELSVLKLACSLVGVLAVDLGDCLTGLDAANLRLVLTAVAAANGRPGVYPADGGLTPAATLGFVREVLASGCDPERAVGLIGRLVDGNLPDDLGALRARLDGSGVDDA